MSEFVPNFVNENKIINTLEYEYYKISLYQWFDSVLGIMTRHVLFTA